MKQDQIIENRRELKGFSDADADIILPEEPVIWIANHAFRDDVAASISAAKRHAYILFGSLPQFYNTFDGISAYLNGVVMANRKVKASSSTSVERAVKIMQQNTDLLIFPEGVWNKTPEKLLLNFWPGVYHISKATGAKIVPIIHYSKNPIDGALHNEIHTVVDDPIKIDDLSKNDALSYLRETMGTWYYLMMEKYGKSTRKDELEGFKDTNAAWEYQLTKRIEVVDRYDTEIERSADYCPKDVATPAQVWEPVSQIKHATVENAPYIAYASKQMDLLKRFDFQHRF